jgi:hypothetical protein
MVLFVLTNNTKIEHRVARHYYKDINNCVALFDEYAKEHNFDPSDVAAWYKVDMSELGRRKVRQKKKVEILLI